VVSSKAATPEDYVAELPQERAAVIARVRDLVNSSLPAGYVERMSYGMIGWEVPLEIFPNTYNGQPLSFAALAAQKNHNALYLNCIQASEERTERLKAAFAAEGRKLDMGKSCIRFKQAEELAERAIAEAIASVPLASFIADYEASRRK
jgi:hypothetical protein